MTFVDLVLFFVGLIGWELNWSGVGSQIVCGFLTDDNLFVTEEMAGRYCRNDTFRFFCTSEMR